MTWLIGEAAEKTGLSVDTLRYYERIGLLPPPARDSGGRRLYREQDVARLQFIQRAQAVGFSLEEISQLLRFREDPAGSSHAVRELAAAKYQAVRDQMAVLRKVEAELNLLISLCRGDNEHCPILKHLDQSTG